MRPRNRHSAEADGTKLAGPFARGYAMVPRSLLDHASKLRAGVSVYALLALYTDTFGSCFPTVETISVSLGLSKRTVISATGMLVSLGYVEVERHGRSNWYRLVGYPAKRRKVQPGNRSGGSNGATREPNRCNQETTKVQPGNPNNNQLPITNYQYPPNPPRGAAAENDPTGPRKRRTRETAEEKRHRILGRRSEG